MKTLSLLFLSLVISCSSSKPVQKSFDSDKENELVLNGSSDSGTAGKLRTVLFDYNDSSLSQDAKQVIKDNADFLMSNAGLTVQIEGHCDERGGRQFNLALGEKRAKMIRDYLVGLGIKANRLNTFSYGSEKPVSPESSENGWARNRRGSFVVLSL